MKGCNSSAHKALRLVVMMDELRQRPQGFSTLELTKRFNVCQKTIQRDLLDLQTEPLYLPLIHEDGRWKLFSF